MLKVTKLYRDAFLDSIRTIKLLTARWLESSSCRL